VTIFNKRNAAVGYLTLKALDRRHRRRSGLRLGLYVALGLVSFGILAGVAAVHLRRKRGAAEQLDHVQSISELDETEIVGEYVTTAPEPIPAT
jgi:hypothetical protein